jgi:hypothetical protein
MTTASQSTRGIGAWLRHVQETADCNIVAGL